jgi:AbiTii
VVAAGRCGFATAADTVPDYRHVPTALMAVITNMGGYNGMSRRIDPSVFAPQIRDMLREQEIDLEDTIIGQGVGELEALAGQGKDDHDIIPSWASFIAEHAEQVSHGPNSRVTEVYWSVPNASIRSNSRPRPDCVGRPGR